MAVLCCYLVPRGIYFYGIISITEYIHAYVIKGTNVNISYTTFVNQILLENKEKLLCTLFIWLELTTSTAKAYCTDHDYYTTLENE